jgi:alpha-beta hydrolase superfamily lysophospholipase
MDLSIRRFGRPSREMVGVHQQARNATQPRARFLLCRPLGQEAVRTAAVFRVLADRLAREGCDSLRFDYHGTGDSPGEEHQQSLAQWVEDTLAAHEQLEPGTAVPVIWFGMALGATLALRAALRAKAPPAHLVLWEPVLDGKAYGQTLLDAHRAELTREFGEPWERLLHNGKVVEPTLPGDVLGFQVGAQLAEDLAQLHDVTLAPALRRGIRVTCAVHAEQRPLLAALEGNALLKLHTVESRTNWMSSQAMGTAIVPPDLPRTLLSTLEA